MPFLNQPLAIAKNAKPSLARESASGGDYDLVPIINVRQASPMEVSELGLDFYAAGILDWREYEMLAFQPELQPGFNRTIGALTGEKANPGRRRDYIAIWEERLAFEQKYSPSDHGLIRHIERIIAALRRLESPANIVV